VDLDELDIYLHNGDQWLPAYDAGGSILPGGKGWIVPGSRVNHPTLDPPLVEIEVYHFSAAQAVISGSSSTTDGIERERHGSGATAVITCFIETSGAEGVASLLISLSLLGLLGLIGIGIFIRLKFRLSQKPVTISSLLP
jgi:hypothetical protein